MLCVQYSQQIKYAPCTSPAQLTRQQWKVVVVDRESSKLIENVMRLNDFLDENVTGIVDWCILFQSNRLSGRSN